MQYQTDVTNVTAVLDTGGTAMADAKRTAKRKPQPQHESIQDTAALRALHNELDALDRQAINDFNAIEQHIKDKNLPAIILQRHRDAVATYKTEMAAVKANLDAIGSATNDTDRSVRILTARDHLKAKQAKKGPKTKFDPNDLPNKSLQPNPNNKPKLTPNDFIRAGLISNPSVKLAAHSSFRIDQLPSASDPAYLAATTEVTLTNAIRAKAAELNHNPVQIYNWVRNNVEWIPTWGAAQDAEITLGSKCGNAMDIASLLVALLRASDIPARYVHGTIEVPEDKFRNWAGGFTDIGAAGNYASSGGIPITGIVGGGRITKFQMEHIWVEAAIDFHPSRGAINKSADSWVSLDPSFKKYEFSQGIDIAQISGLNANGVAQTFMNSGTINTTESWVQNLNATIFSEAQMQAQTALKAHIRNNMTNPVVTDIVGGKQIVPQATSVLPTALPYQSLIAGARYGRLPAPLQNKYEIGFGVDILGEANIAAGFPLAKVNNHKLTLSFKPTAPADEQALESLLPAGPITDSSQLPNSIPSYLISVTPEIALEDQIVAQGAPMRLGEEFQLAFQVTQAGGGPTVKTYSVPAGAYLSLSANQGGVSLHTLQDLQAKLKHTKGKLESNDTTLIGTVTREDAIGDMFHAGTLAYWSQYIQFSNTAALNMGAKHNLASGFGSIGYEPNVDSLFGFPRAIKAGVVAVNIWVADVTADMAGDSVRRKDFQIRTGMLSSALEHAIPEEMFNSPGKPAEGISAVKALQIASSQGQRIYHITSANQAQALPNLHLDGLAMQEITTALAAGKEVLAHTDRIAVSGWAGEGYILLDPTTGAGAYKITGGSNGGSLSWCDILVLAILAIIIIALIAALIAILIGGLPALAAAGAVAVEAAAAVAAYVEAAVAALPLAIRALAAASLMGVLSTEAAASDITDHCGRLYMRCVQEGWGGDWSCNDCHFYCTGINQEWPFWHCSPDKKCRR